MVSGYVLILAMLMLGGVIATLGDRIGMRVGKARLSLFNLRPRQTATLVSIVTGSVISASTLAILFGVSSQLRTGVFELGRIQDDLANAEAQLANALAEQEDVKADLDAAATERQRALTRLREINQSLDQAVDQQEITQIQLQRTRDQLTTVSQQAQALRQSTDSLRAERDQLIQQQATIRNQIANRDRAIADLDETIAARDKDIAEREHRLAELQTQQSLLDQQVADLQNQYEDLFRGNIALSRNQELLYGLAQADSREDATRIINELLYEANRRAIQAIVPGNPPDQQVILIGNREVENLIDRLSTGEEYVIRLLSAANYVTGEPCVVRGEEPCIQIFIDATANQQVYQKGERLATVSLDTVPFEDSDLVERLNLLFVSTQFRARQDGVVDDRLQVADNRTETLLRFLAAIQQYGQAIDLQAVAADDIYNAGPLQVDIVASRDGRVLFSTNSFAASGNNAETPGVGP